MLFIKRDENNAIMGVFNLAQQDATEEIAMEHLEVQAFINRPIPLDVNKQLENAFLSVLPNHLGKSYLNVDLLLMIASLKQSVTDFNRLGLYTISKQMIEGLVLPEEMDADKQALLALFPVA
jgi:hypothetical protein